MQEQTIAVITLTIRGFVAYVYSLYESIPSDKSIVMSNGPLYITIEHPNGVGTKYIPIQKMADLRGRVFDKVESILDSYLLKDYTEIKEAASSIYLRKNIAQEK